MNSQDIPSSFQSSNLAELRAWRLLGRLLAGLREDRPADTSALLGHVLEALGGERAFLVAAPETGRRVAEPRVVARCCRRPDGATRPSRSLVLHALAGRRVWVGRDTEVDCDNSGWNNTWGNPAPTLSTGELLIVPNVSW